MPTFVSRPLLACAALLLPAAAGAQTAFPADSTIRRIIEGRVEEGRSAAIAVGMIEPDGRIRFLAAGSPGPGRMPVDRESVFEIGSITKAFTGVLLADMVRTGDVAFDDPVSRYLPDSVTVPARGGKQITLEHLSTQRSGLPRLPRNFRPADPLNPYADDTVAQMYAFLSGYTLPRDPGAQYEYSNLGVGLLGHALARAAGRSYEELLKTRILEPLGMEHTGITLTPRMREHVVAGHSASGDEVPLWDLPTLAGAGALRSTMNDLLTFIEASLRGEGPLHRTMETAMARRADTGSTMMTVGLGWHRRAADGDTIVWHNGGTGGFRTFAGFDPVAGTGVVVLTNSGGEGADDIGFHLLHPALPLNEPEHRASDLPASVR